MDHQLFRTPGDPPGEGNAGASLARRRNPGRNSTEGTQQHILLSSAGASPGTSHTQDDLAAQDESFSELSGNAFSSFRTRSSSWESNSMSGEVEEGQTGAASKDRRSFVDVTTPTLVDEFDEEEEAEMVSLEQERLRLSREDGMMSRDDSHLRRTPGANMYSSALERSDALRRTPGASAMHRSAVASNVVAPAPKKAGTDASVLGFGLTLSTPVAGDERSAGTRRARDEEQSSSSSTSSISETITEQRPLPQDQSNRPPRAPHATAQGRDMYSYTPAGLTLSKNPNLEFSRGAFSPNTIRLTEALDSLLQEDEDTTASTSTGPFHKKQAFRGQSKGAPASQSSPRVMFSSARSAEDDSGESWTKSYIFDSEGGKASTKKLPKAGFSRSRRGRNDGGKRNKNVPGGQSNTGGALFSPQQPKPLRHSATNSLHASGFLPPAEAKKSGMFNHDDDDRASPRPLTFGGAFVPPSKDMKNLKRPVASSARGPGYEASVAAASLPREDAHNTSSASGMAGAADGSEFHRGGSSPQVLHHHHNHSGFESGPPLAVNAQPFVPYHMPGPMGPSQGSPHEFQFHPPTNVQYPPGHVFGPHVAMPSSSPMGHPSVSPFPMNPPFGHPYGQDYQHIHNQQPPSPQFGLPGWAPMAPMQFDGNPLHRNAGWHGGTGSGWGSAGELGYGMPTPGMMESSNPMALSPPSPFIPYSEHESFAHMHPRIDTPPLVHDHRFVEAIGNSGSRPRVRSMDSLTPSNVPVEGRSRRQTWDQGSGSATPFTKREAQRKTSQRRQRKSDATSKQKDKAKNKKNNDEKGRKKSAPSSPKKKKNTKGPAGSPSDATGGPRQKSPQSGTKKREGSMGDRIRTSPSIEETTDMKRAELVESPATRVAFKSFYRNFRVKERLSFREAEEFALQNLKDEAFPENLRWRVYLELADLAKRANKFEEARKLYQQVCELQPYASQGWLEYSKLEEECGHLNRCTKILHDGLEYCEFSEGLLTRAIKHEEKMGRLEGARQLLARLKHVGIEKVWRTVLEGALLEARAGNAVMARRVLKYLMHHIPWYGPLYLEAYRLERDMGRPQDALAIVERGLKAIPRYGPLWFSAFRLCEALDISEKLYNDMPRTVAMLDRATNSISRELVWKVHLDAAQIFERAAIHLVAEKQSISVCSQLTLSRKRFATTVLTCPPNLCWKVWLASGRMELASGNTDNARRLFLRANEVVPEKCRAAALLECSRLEEFVDNTEVARAILCKTRSEVGSDWKVWLESVVLEIRSGEHRRAIELADRALEIHSGTGRLWAALVQLRQVDGEEAQYRALRSALKAVPKSGEVWCEGARIHLNPFSLLFDLEKARRHLFFATKFTPQYGDSFLESLRLQLIEKWISPVAARLWEHMKKKMNEVDLEGEVEPFIAQSVHAAVRSILERHDESHSSSKKEATPIDVDVASSCRESLKTAAFNQMLDFSELELRCANADPNYGLLWFHCRDGPTDTARVVLARAKEKLINEMRENAHIYVAAVIRRLGVVGKLLNESGAQGSNFHEDATSDYSDISEERQKVFDARLLESPSVGSILYPENTNEEAGLVLLEKSTSASNFITGLVELNAYKPLRSLSPYDRRKALFGSDSLLS